MSELKNFAAIELSETELDAVAGGLSITIGDPQGFSQTSANDFSQKNLTIAQKTFAGPEGSGTASVFNLDVVKSSAALGISVF